MTFSSQSLPVWITRTDTLAAQSADAVMAAGYQPIIAPLLTLAAASIPAAAPSEKGVLAFTSRNGVAAFARLTDRRDWPAYCVGAATAKAAREIGFRDIHASGADAAALARRLISDGRDKIVHYSGVHIAGDLVGDLTAAGLRARREIIYESRAAQALPAKARDALNQKQLAVLLYSPKAARTFIKLLPQGFTAKLSVISISANVDAVLEASKPPFKFEKRLIAHSPDEMSMIDALETIAAKA